MIGIFCVCSLTELNGILTPLQDYVEQFAGLLQQRRRHGWCVQVVLHSPPPPERLIVLHVPILWQ